MITMQKKKPLKDEKEITVTVNLTLAELESLYEMVEKLVGSS